jgi:hypothetical protein
MNQTKVVSLTLILFIFTFVLVSSASAAGLSDCDDCIAWPEAFAKLLTIAVQNMSLSMVKTLSGIAWFFDKAAIFVFDLVVNEGLWGELRDSLLTNLSAFMPDVLEDLIGGSNGLLYVAIMLAGVTMTLPFLGTSKLVRLDQVILWGILVTTLFIGGSTGYDLIGAFEDLRMSMMEVIMTGRDNRIESIVTGPMMADSGDMVLADAFKLPDDFEDEYFPPAQSYETVKIVLFEAGLSAVAEAEMETDASLEHRKEMAAPGIAIALLSTIGGYVALIFALIFAMLTTAALGLIIFLMASLPMGFFEFGRTIMAGILQKYLQIVVLSLGSAIFVGLITHILGVLNSVSSIATVLRYAAIMLPVVGVQHMFLRWAFEAMMSTKDVFGQTMQSVFSVRGASRPATMKTMVGAGLAAASSAALLGLPGGSGKVASIALNALSGAVSSRISGAQTPRGNVFAEMAKNVGGNNA